MQMCRGAAAAPESVPAAPHCPQWAIHQSRPAPPADEPAAAAGAGAALTEMQAARAPPPVPTAADGPPTTAAAGRDVSTVTCDVKSDTGSASGRVMDVTAGGRRNPPTLATILLLAQHVFS